MRCKYTLLYHNDITRHYVKWQPAAAGNNCPHPFLILARMLVLYVIQTLPEPGDSLVILTRHIPSPLGKLYLQRNSDADV
jgi:hypothetical protein